MAAAPIPNPARPLFLILRLILLMFLTGPSVWAFCYGSEGRSADIANVNRQRSSFIPWVNSWEDSNRRPAGQEKRFWAFRIEMHDRKWSCFSF